ncbi:TonB-dependent receptor [Nonlabens ponticola]|uniref:TonB-dependent receptor n=1 Tax=Nonlabens ponticola TaxID=2496866 RepID=A0A3S9MXR2_9FLAO|nr:TonB-dependent receptor [Nonlabens ponticola]AZQ43833.1 TonB-dependent receptor [Nonlabens ponticola]
MFLKNIVVIVLLSAITATAQDCRIQLKGVVTDFHDAAPLELAQVYIKEAGKTGTTNELGEYQIKNLCAGDYTVVVTHFSCETKTLNLSLRRDMTYNVKLEHHINDLEQVDILADVHDNHDQTQSSTRVDQETINKYSGATLGDALATVQGVSALKTGNSVVKPVIHGVYGSRVTIVNNGLRQQDQEWGLEHSPNIDVNTAANIEVVKGATALRYGGDAIGGTIIIEPERFLAMDTLKGKLISQLQSNGRGGSLTGTIGNYNNSGWYQRVTLTGKRLGDYEAPDYVLSNTGEQTFSGNLAVGYQQFEYGGSINYSYYNTELGILRASHIGNSTNLVRSINSGQPNIVRDFTYDIDPPKQQVEHHGLQLKGFKRFANLGKLEVDYAFQFNNRLEFDIRRGANAGRASLDLDLTTHTLAAYLLVDSLEDIELELGVDGLHQINEPNPATGIRRLIPDYDSQKIGGFISANKRFHSKWLVDAGVRYDLYRIAAQKFYQLSRWEDLGYDEQFPQFEVRETSTQILTNPEFDYSLLAFSAGVKYFVDDHYDFAINLSSASRAPNPSELFSDGLHHALATIELGQLDLRKERSYKLNLTAHAGKGGFNAVDIEVNPYLSLVKDYIQLVPIGLETTTRGAFPVYQYEQVDALLAGVDVGASWDIVYTELVDPEDPDGNPELFESLRLNSRFSYIYGENTTDDEPLILIPPTQFYNELVWSNGIIDNLSFTLANQSVLTQTRFPDDDYEVNIPDDQGNFQTVTVEISEAPSGFSLWNAGVSYAFAKAQLNLRVNNLLNTNYRNYLNRQRFYADDIGRDFQLQFIYNF